MAKYGIYVLDESMISISNGGVLDGITQGDGSHLAGQTLTLNSGAWHQVFLNDANTTFDDNDASQTLDGAQTVNGTDYAGGTRVEAEYTLTVSDGSKTYTLVGFNVNDSNPAYGTVEGLAFIGGPGGFPPVGVPLSVVSASEGPRDFQAADYATPICFAAGMRIAVPGGRCAVEDLRPGDRVCTLHHGARRLEWVGARSFRATGAAAPVRFAPGALGNDAPLVVSPQHRIHMASARAELMFGASEVLVPALHFVNGTSVTRVEGGTVRYHHLLFAQHQVLFAEGVPSESFYPGPAALAAMERNTRAELLALFPEVADRDAGYGTAAAPGLRRHEARALLAA